MSGKHHAGKARSGESRENHPSQADLKRFMRGELPRPEVRAIVRHLMAGCPECLEVTRRLFELGERPPGFEASLRYLAALIRERPARDEPGLY